MIRTTIILTILLILSAFQTKADYWTDPDWKEMIDSSDVIALVEYTSNGDFRARAKPITIYKGKLNANEIWISGFSSRFEPIDKMSPGDKYIVFLNFYKPTDKTLDYWREQIKKDPDLTDYYEAIKAGNAYYVWSPTSGDLKVKGKNVQYDLLQTSYYSKQNFYPLVEFEAFLKTSAQTDRADFHKQILMKVVSNPSDENCAQNLMMLYLTSFQSFDPVFQTIADEQKPESCYALAQLLGKVKGEKSRDVIVQLLDNKNSIVQGEAVRQLSSQDPQFIGPIHLAHLDSAGEGGIYPSNIMDPKMNQIDGGKIEIIKTLGKLKYKPAAKVLLPLLETEEDYLFVLVINVLIELESKDFIPYIIDHLKKETKSLIFEICEIIAYNDLKECKPALMEFISIHNRNDHPTHEYSVSSHMGLAHFDDQETRDFLLNDFKNLLTNNDSIESAKLEAWIKEYIDVFRELKCEEARPLIYSSLFKWFGLNNDFVLHPKLFDIKKNLEDSINQRALLVLKGDGVDEIQSLAFIKNTSDFGDNFVPEFDLIVLIKLDYTSMKLSGNESIWNKLRMVREKISKELGIPLESVCSRSGSNVSNLDERFDINITFSPMYKFYEYSIELPSHNDLMFFKALADNDFMTEDDDKKELTKTIEKIEAKLKK